jgi:hypothetical protein
MKRDGTYPGNPTFWLVLMGFVSKASEAEAMPKTASKVSLLNIMVKIYDKIG